MKTKKQNVSTGEMMIGLAIVGAVIGLALSTSSSAKQEFSNAKTELLAILEKNPRYQEMVQKSKKGIKDKKIAELRSQMYKAVFEERYEEAAKLRDEIKRMETA